MAARTLYIPREHFERSRCELYLGRSRANSVPFCRYLDRRGRRGFVEVVVAVLRNGDPAGGLDLADMEETEHRINVRLEDTEGLALVWSRQTRFAVLTDIANLRPHTLGLCLDLEEGQPLVVVEIPEALVFFGGQTYLPTFFVIEPGC